MNAVRKPVYCLLATLLCLGAAQATAEEAEATLREVVGTVFVNQSKVYEPAQSGAKLPLHTRVLTKDGASAVVLSRRGCATRLRPNSVFVIHRLDPCQGGALAQNVDADAIRAATGAIRTGAAAGGGLFGGLTATGGILGLSTTGLALAGAGVAAAMAGGIAAGTSSSGGGGSVDAPAIGPISPP